MSSGLECYIKKCFLDIQLSFVVKKIEITDIWLWFFDETSKIFAEVEKRLDKKTCFRKI